VLAFDCTLKQQLVSYRIVSYRVSGVQIRGRFNFSGAVSSRGRVVGGGVVLTGARTCGGARRRVNIGTRLRRHASRRVGRSSTTYPADRRHSDAN